MDLRFRDDRRRALDQQPQQIERFWREVHLRAVAKKLTAIGMELEVPKPGAHERSPGFPRVPPNTPRLRMRQNRTIATRPIRM